jgi:hypothetical protein
MCSSFDEVADLECSIKSKGQIDRLVRCKRDADVISPVFALRRHVLEPMSRVDTSRRSRGREGS